MIIVVCGPTAVGKTKMSVELAKIYNGEIINADSTQVYKGMDIGTAKATKEEMCGIKHHLLDIVDVDKMYTVFDYQKDGREKIEEIKSRGKIPIIVGGTGLYIKALLYNYDFVDYENDLDYSEYDLETLQEKVDNKDIDLNNRRRVINEIKRSEASKEQLLDKDNLLYDDVYFIGLTTDRDTLYKRIDERFDSMLIPLVDEVYSFYEKGIKSKALNTAIGYKELYKFFDHECTFVDAVDECKQNSRNYAKRQYTWFNNQMDVNWFNVDFDNFNNTINEVVDFIETE